MIIFNKKFKHETRDDNEKTCSRCSDTVSHYIDFLAYNLQKDRVQALK